MRSIIAAVGVVLAIGVSIPATAIPATAAAAGASRPAAGASRPAAGASRPAAARAAAPPEHPLFGVSCTSSKFCVAVGEQYPTRGSVVRPLAETWNGKKWATMTVKLSPAATEGFLEGVSCPSAKSCVAVGAYLVKGNETRALAETWNGKTWTQSKPPVPGSNPDVILDAVSCASARYCVGVGSVMSADLAGAALIETWNGRAWTAKTAGFPAGNESGDLNGVSCPSARRCLAVGGYYLRTGGTRVVTESWNGRSWSQARPALPAYAKSPLGEDVSCASTTSCVLVGAYNSTSSDVGGFSLSWNGRKWSGARVAKNAVMSAVSCLSSKACVAVGRLITPVGRLTPPSGGVWNGKSWRIVTVPHPRTSGVLAAGYLDDVKCLTASDCVAVGAAVNTAESSAGYSEFWNGKSWKLVAVA